MTEGNIGNVATLDDAVAALTRPNGSSRRRSSAFVHKGLGDGRGSRQSCVAPQERLGLVKGLSLDPPARADFRPVVSKE
jgi:hypothetical protein